MTDVTALARRWRLDINLGTDAVPVWTLVPGITDVKPVISPTFEPSQDYAAAGWLGNTKTALAWSLEVRLWYRLNPTTLAANPAQEALRACALAFGDEGLAHVRWYDRSGVGEAHEGRALVTWAPEGGGPAALDSVAVTFTGDGAPVDIANPAGGA